MFKEHEQIVLTDDVFGDEREELKSGDVGTIIHIHPDQEALVGSRPWPDLIALFQLLPGLRL